MSSQNTINVKKSAALDNPEPLIKASLELEIGGHSMSGAKSRNDDAFAAHIPTSKYIGQIKGGVACIADGISVSERSHLASQLAVTQFIDDYYATPESWSVEDAASRVLRALNDWLFSQSRHNQTHAMVTTFSSVIIKSNSAHIFHIGDSRIYRIHGDQIELITRDHNMSLTRSAAVLTASLGMDSRLAVDYSQISVEVGDIFVLLTDGILEGLTENDILSHLTAVHCLDKIAQNICEAALENGSSDNLTAGVLKIKSLPVENFDEAFARIGARKIPPVMAVGNVIDDYKIIDILHNGTRSHVYKVKNLKTGENFVLKAPSLNFADDPVYLNGFIREQWVGRRLNHPGLMRSVAPERESAFLYILSEHVSGQTLRSWMIDNPSPKLSEVRSIVRQIITALRQLHRMGMIHRDVKPENIMVTAQSDIKIIDFGTVRIAGMEDLSSPIEDEHAAGAVNYSAPELVLGQPATSRSDIFSLGVLTHELLTGQRPFADIENSHHKKTSFGDWRFKRDIQMGHKHIPNWVFLTIEAACAPNPDKRYPVMSEFYEDLLRPGTRANALGDSRTQMALLERNPLAFWKGLALLSFGLSLILLILLIQKQSI